jgi:nucleotide-binding universal stress UspA family protein
MPAIRSIVHPTDFSDASADAFAHALRIALTVKGSLHILHVATAGDETDWISFPQVRTALARWGLMGENEVPAAVCSKLGVKIAKVELAPQSTIGGILHFLDAHPADLMVLATDGRQGVARWLHGSTAEKLAFHAKAPTLFVPARMRGFVDQARGEVHLRRVLIPVDHEPKPAAAVGTIMRFVHALAGADVGERLLHVGRNPPQVQRHSEPHHPIPVAIRHGDVVEAIIDAAADWQADLIGMATAGHHGFLDILRGSTTERVLRQAPCPLLAVPVKAAAA